MPHKKNGSRFFTKPLQGPLFNTFIDMFLGNKHISTLHEDDKDSSSQDRVGIDVSKGEVKRSDDGLYVIGGTQIGKNKRSGDSPSFVGSTQRGMSYAEALSKRQTNNRKMVDNNLILLK